MLLAGFGLVCLLLGFAIAWYGLRPLTVLPRLLRADVCEPATVSATDEFVVCRGIANEAGDALSAPFTGTHCLGFEFEVTERQPFGVGVPWFQAHLDDGVATVPFTLDGERGTVGVVPDSKRFSLDTETTVIGVGSNETAPDRIQQFVAVRDALSPPAQWLRAIPGLGARRYSERRIDPGAEYVVAGQPDRRHGGTVLAGNLVIGDRSPRAIAATRLWNAMFPLVVAGGFVAVGVWGILS